jgi:hypothetical protein
MLYTADAKNYLECPDGLASSEIGIKNYIEQKILKDLNACFENSGVDINFEIIMTEKTTLPTTIDIRNDIKYLTGESKYTKNINAKNEVARIQRNRGCISNGADFVGLFCYNKLASTRAGHSRYSTRDGKLILDPDKGYFIVDLGVFTAPEKDNISQTVAHEIGHIMGLGHDKVTAIKYKENLKMNAISNDVHGYVISNENSRVCQTIMAYGEGNLTLEEYMNKAIPYFSTIGKTIKDVEEKTKRDLSDDDEYVQSLAIGTISDPDNYNANEVSVLSIYKNEYSQFRTKYKSLANGCEGGFPKVLASISTEAGNCGYNGCILNETCDDMKNYLNGDCNNTHYKNYNSYYPKELKDKHMTAEYKPMALFVRSKQSRVEERDIAGSFSKEGVYRIKIDYIVSCLSQQLSTVMLPYFFKCDFFVDGIKVVNSLNCDKTTLFNANSSSKYSYGSTYTDVYLKPTDKKLQILIQSENIEKPVCVFSIHRATIYDPSIQIEPKWEDPVSNNNAPYWESLGYSDISVSQQPIQEAPCDNGLVVDQVTKKIKIRLCNQTFFPKNVWDGNSGIFPGYTGKVRIGWGDGNETKLNLADLEWWRVASNPIKYVDDVYYHDKTIEEQGYVEHTYSSPGEKNITVTYERRTYDWQCTYNWLNIFMANPLPTCGYISAYKWYEKSSNKIKILSDEEIRNIMAQNVTYKNIIQKGRTVSLTNEDDYLFSIVNKTENTGNYVYTGNVQINWDDETSEIFKLDLSKECRMNNNCAWQIKPHKYAKFGKYNITVSYEQSQTTWGVSFPGYPATSVTKIVWIPMKSKLVDIKPDLTPILNLLLGD